MLFRGRRIPLESRAEQGTPNLAETRFARPRQSRIASMILRHDSQILIVRIGRMPMRRPNQADNKDREEYQQKPRSAKNVEHNGELRLHHPPLLSPRRQIPPPDPSPK